jgi:hypothetical protein
MSIAVCANQGAVGRAALVPVRFFRNSLSCCSKRSSKQTFTSLFPGMNPGPCHRFRVTRDADIEIREEEAEDLLSLIQEELRREGSVRRCVWKSLRICRPT